MNIKIRTIFENSNPIEERFKYNAFENNIKIAIHINVGF